MMLSAYLVSSAYYVGYHPIFKARTLIQLGHEPVAPRITTTIFGRKALMLPGLQDYILHMYKAEGFLSLYGGLPLRLAGDLIQGKVGNATRRQLHKLRSDENKMTEVSGEWDGILGIPTEEIKSFLLDTSEEMCGRVVGCVVMHPLQLMAVRTVAQFVGKETVYGGLGSIMEVYRAEGLTGFFNGLLPRVLCEVLTCWSVAVATFLINKMLIKDKDVEHVTQPIVSLAVSSVLYPFSLVATVMMVNGSTLQAASPPNMKQYDDWLHCWKDLELNNQIKRGSSLFFRYVATPNTKFLPMNTL